MQKSRVQANCEKRFHLAVKGSGGISIALKFSLTTLKECHYSQALLHVFWHKLISLCCFMSAHFVHPTLCNLSYTSIHHSFPVSFLKQVSFSASITVSVIQQISFAYKAPDWKSGPGSRVPPLTSQYLHQEINPSYREQPSLEVTINVGQPKEDACEFKTIHRPGETIKNTFHY